MILNKQILNDDQYEYTKYIFETVEGIKNEFKYPKYYKIDDETGDVKFYYLNSDESHEFEKRYSLENTNFCILVRMKKLNYIFSNN
jgi:hypothetical protein